MNVMKTSSLTVVVATLGPGASNSELPNFFQFWGKTKQIRKFSSFMLSSQAALNTDRVKSSSSWSAAFCFSLSTEKNPSCWYPHHKKTLTFRRATALEAFLVSMRKVRMIWGRVTETINAPKNNEGERDSRERPHTHLHLPPILLLAVLRDGFDVAIDELLRGGQRACGVGSSDWAARGGLKAGEEPPLGVLGSSYLPSAARPQRSGSPRAPLSGECPSAARW